MLRHVESILGRAGRRRCTVGSSSVIATRLVLALLVPTLLLAGCGGSGRPRPKVCRLKAQEAIGRDLRVGAGSIRYIKSIGGNAMPQCVFTARTARHRVVVVVNVDNGPQAYFRLLRTVAEASQIFGVPPPGFHPPQGVSGLGPFASWFPNNHQLMATNYADLITVSVTWPGARRNTEVRLARAAVIPYMFKAHGHLDKNDYP